MPSIHIKNEPQSTYLDQRRNQTSSKPASVALILSCLGLFALVTPRLKEQALSGKGVGSRKGTASEKETACPNVPLEKQAWLVDYWAKIKDVIANQDNIIVKYELEGTSILIGLLTATGLVYKDSPVVAGILAFAVSVVSMILMKASFFYYGLLVQAANTAVEIEKKLLGEERLAGMGLTFRLSAFSSRKVVLGMDSGSFVTVTTLGGVALLGLCLSVFYLGWWGPILSFMGDLVSSLLRRI